MGYNSKYKSSEIEEILDSVGGKQDNLISGTNIKTINGESILGSGDLTIESGAKIYEWFYDGESESITLSQEEYDNIVEADLVVVNLGGLFSVTVSKTSKEVSEALGYYALIGQLEAESEGIKLHININIKISTKVATITIEEQEILTKISQLENDSNFVALQGEELPYVETAGLYDPISSVLYSLPGGEWTGAEDKKLAGVVNVGGFNLVECQGITGSSGDMIVLPREADGYEDDILVTRSYLKTINGESILGSGDIEISGGSGGEDIRYFTEFTVEQILATTTNTLQIDNSELLGAIQNNKLICIPYQEGVNGFIVASYKEESCIYFLDERVIYKLDIMPIAIIISRIYLSHNTVYSNNTDPWIEDVYDNSTYIESNPATNTLRIRISEDLLIGSTIRFTTGEDCSLQISGRGANNLLWANGVIPTIEPGVTYELSLRTDYTDTRRAYAVLTPFKLVE